MPELNTLLYLAMLLLGGLLCGRLVKQVKLPNVTGYLIVGLLFGPHVLNVIPLNVIHNFEILSNIALAFIAFTIGNEFRISYFKRVGMMPIVIAIFESLTAVLLVQGILIVAGFDVAFSIVLGAIAAATAPAATVMVIKQYKAKGPVTETLLSVVALDDAAALIVFGFAISIAEALRGGVNGGFPIYTIITPFLEVIAALGVGMILGLVFKFPLRYFKKSSNRQIITCGMVFLASGIANLIDISQLLTCMTMGAMLCNITRESENIAKLAEYVTPPIFVLFFAVSGAELNIELIPSIGMLGLLYVIFRAVGKMLGATIGAKIMKADPAICKYLGPTLLPQAGVAIGLVSVASTVVPHFAPKIRAVVLCGTLIYEIIGPAVTKLSLKKAGEI